MSDLLTGIRRLYDGLWDTSSWQDGLEEVCAALRAHHIIVVSRAAEGGPENRFLCGAAHVAAEQLQVLGQEAAALMLIADGMHVGRAMDTSEVLPDRELRESWVYRRIIRPMGGHYGMTVSPFAGSFLAVCRPPTAARFSRSEIERLQTVLPHLQTALRLKRHLVGLESRAMMLEQALESLGVGVLIAAGSGRTLYANPSAEATLRTIRDAGAAAAAGRRMREIIERPDGRRHAVSRGALQRPVIVRAVPVGGRAAECLPPGSECRVAVFLRDPEQRDDAPRAELMASLGLTPREASLADLLARDMTLTEAAATLGITRENARVHLKRILSKTDTRRQAELVSLIGRLRV